MSFVQKPYLATTLEQEGQIDFYQFDFSLGNVLDIIAVSKPKSQQMYYAT